MQAISKAELSFETTERPQRSVSARTDAVGLAGAGQAAVTEGTGAEGKGAKVRATLRARLGD
ncbi:MAG TPA: chromosomal replication initiator protein DnaA, partial [Hyphomicrobium sp.]|nr:chromosomal replication initiator protein DnaA [Hyphomicrobium sp.]